MKEIGIKWLSKSYPHINYLVNLGCQIKLLLYEKNSRSTFKTL